MNYFTERQKLGRRLNRIEKEDFADLSLAIFRFQAHFNPVYAKYLSLLGRQVEQVKQISAIPFLPIQLFKSQPIQTGVWQPETIFTSSGTTGQLNSQHYVKSLEKYAENTRRGFNFFYGPVQDYCILALLPAYLERQGSSLVYMAQRFIKWSKYPESGFFLHNFKDLTTTLQHGKASNSPVMLIGVSFALWELAEKFPQDLSGCIIMETGGMKGKREEITRANLHQILKEAFNVKTIHSEYGMTELFSQAYSQGLGIYHPSPSMRVFTREISDPLTPQQTGKTGVINIIDLANLDTISFIATEDLGRVYADNTFEIMGRLDASDLRGCNLMVE